MISNAGCLRQIKSLIRFAESTQLIKLVGKSEEIKGIGSVSQGQPDQGKLRQTECSLGRAPRTQHVTRDVRRHARVMSMSTVRLKKGSHSSLGNYELRDNRIIIILRWNWEMATMDFPNLWILFFSIVVQFD